MQTNWTIRELVSILILTVFVLALCLPLSEASARTSRAMMNMTNLRGIHQGLVTHSNSNKDWFAGLDSSGKDAGITVEERFFVLLDGDFFTPEYALSPMENDPSISAWPGSGSVTSSHYSFAMLQVPPTGARRDEWKTTLNPLAIVIADRNTGTPSSTYSYQNDRWTSSTTFGCTHRRRQPYLNMNHWVGNVLWNDSMSEFATADSPPTQYGSVKTPSDNLFNSPGNDDALLIHAGN